MATNEKMAAQLERLQILSTAFARARFADRLGLEYSGMRDIYEALGYKKRLEYEDFLARYERQDIARAVIDKPVDATWNGGFYIEETKEKNQEETALEKAWKELVKNRDLMLFDKLSRLDKLVGIGRYAVLFLGLSDATTRGDFAKQPPSNTQLLYCRPLGENKAEIFTKEKNTRSPRYGQPLQYKISLANETGLSDLIVHHSRVLHVAGEMLEGTTVGNSRLKPIYNRLMDLEKLVGGSAEMFWRGARPGYTGKVGEDFTLDADDEDALQEQLDEYEHYLRRFLIMRGIDLSAMESQIEDPSKHVDVQIQMIAAQTGIAKRILTGSERGELSSMQDITSWNSLIESRRTGFVEHNIARPFIDRCIWLGVLPEAKQDYSLVWNKPMFEQTAQEKAEVGKIRATALKEYASQPTAESIVPPEAFYRFFLGLSPDEIEVIQNMQEQAMVGET